MTRESIAAFAIIALTLTATSCRRTSGETADRSETKFTHADVSKLKEYRGNSCVDKADYVSHKEGNHDWHCPFKIDGYSFMCRVKSSEKYTEIDLLGDRIDWLREFKVTDGTEEEDDRRLVETRYDDRSWPRIYYKRVRKRLDIDLTKAMDNSCYNYASSYAVAGEKIADAFRDKVKSNDCRLLKDGERSIMICGVTGLDSDDKRCELRLFRPEKRLDRPAEVKYVVSLGKIDGTFGRIPSYGEIIKRESFTDPNKIKEVVESVCFLKL